MSVLLCLRMASVKTNRFIRPKGPFDAVSTALRLVLRGKGLRASLEYTNAVAQDMADEFADVLMATLDNARALSTDDTCALQDSYTGNENDCKFQPFMAKAEKMRPLVHQC